VTLDTAATAAARPARSPLMTVALVVWSLVFIGCCARTLVVRPKGTVYPVFSNAGGNWLHGDPLYVRGGANEFRYSPLIAAFFVPFDLLPQRLGEFLWRMLNFGVYLIGLVYCCRVDLPRKLSTDEHAGLLLLVLPLSIGSLNNAQSNPLVIGLMLIAVAAAMRDRWMLLALSITGATLFKLYPISLGMLLILLYPRQLSWRLLVCLLIATAIPFVLQHPTYVRQQYTTWAHYLSTEDRQGGPIADWYRDLRAVWRIYIGPMSAKRYFLVELAAATAIALVALLGQLQKWPRGFLLATLLSLACCWMTALGPATESATYVLLAPAVAWTLIESGVNPKDHIWRVGYGAVFGLFAASQCALWFGEKGKWFRDRLQPLPVAGVLLFLILLADVGRRLIRSKVTSENV
jgi:hypothetical protein